MLDTAAILESAPATSVALRWIPGGDLGTWATLRAMADLAFKGAFHREVRAVAGSLGASVPSRDEARQIAAIRAYLSRYVRFTPDPAIAEYLQEPRVMIQEAVARGYATGDCDDVAMLGAALGISIGLSARYCVLGFFDPNAPFEHVYAELRNTGTGQWCELDTTRPMQAIPESMVTRREYWPIC
jgi:transglutaminase-like putative cysteine protease